MRFYKAHSHYTQYSDTTHLSFVVIGTLEVFIALATTTTETMDLIDDLCSHEEGWSTVMPIDQQAALCAPSHSVISGVPEEVLMHTKTGLHDKPCHNNVALESAVGGIIHKLSFPIIAYRGEPKEASVQEGMILLILSSIKVYQHAPMIPTNTSGGLFDVRLVPEDKIELRRSCRGRCPEFYFIASVENSGDGTIIKFILVEVRKRSAQQLQLASYAGKVGTRKKFKGQTLVSVLIDPEY